MVASLNIQPSTMCLILCFTALGDSVAIIVGQLLGAGDMKKARDTDNKMIAFSVMCCTCVAMVMFVMAPLFPMLYNTNAEARRTGEVSDYDHCILYAAECVCMQTYFTLRSGGKDDYTFLFDSVFYLVRQCADRVCAESLYRDSCACDLCMCAPGRFD